MPIAAKCLACLCVLLCLQAAGGLASGAVRVDRSGSTDEQVASSMAPFGGALLPLTGLLQVHHFRDPGMERMSSQPQSARMHVANARASHKSQ